jgi:AbiA family abortive infection protein
VNILSSLLSDFIEPTVQQKCSFDAITQGEIESFLSFIQNHRLGIPQSDNDIISNFIGYLYLVFGDLFIEEEIEKHLNLIDTYQITRYMDDYYISLIFKENITRFEKERTVNIISAHIADIFYQRLGLRMNTKTRLYWLDDNQDKEDLKKNLKRVSPGYEDEEEDDEDTETPAKKINKIFGQLKKLKDSPLDASFKLNRDVDTDVFKEIFNEKVMDLLAKPSNIKRISKVFEGFNFDLVIAQPREITIILLHSKPASLLFEEYLLLKDRLSSRDAFLILTYLCQTNFNSLDLIKKLKMFDQFNPVMDAFEKGMLCSESPGYYNLHESQVLKIAKMNNVIEQIRLRVFAEQKKQYSVALSHLLNEVHSIAWQLDSSGIDQIKYNATHVLDFLTKRGVPHEIRIKIRNLFDRRNKTPVSHADISSWHVTELEYFDYRNQVGECLKYIL